MLIGVPLRRATPVIRRPRTLLFHGPSRLPASFHTTSLSSSSLSSFPHGYSSSQKLLHGLRIDAGHAIYGHHTRLGGASSRFAFRTIPIDARNSSSASVVSCTESDASSSSSVVLLFLLLFLSFAGEINGEGRAQFGSYYAETVRPTTKGLSSSDLFVGLIDR